MFQALMVALVVLEKVLVNGRNSGGGGGALRC